MAPWCSSIAAWALSNQIWPFTTSGSDNTAYNSSLKQASKKGGAYAHIWEWSRSKGWLLIFFIACLSHAACNEVKQVIKAAGPATRTQFVRSKTKRTTTAPPDPDQADMRAGKKGQKFRLQEFLACLQYVVSSTGGCLAYLRIAEAIERLGKPPGGSKTQSTPVENERVARALRFSSLTDVLHACRRLSKHCNHNGPPCIRQAVVVLGR